MKVKCDIARLRTEFPQKFEPWTSEGEALLAKHGCDIVSVTSKNGTPEHLIGNRVNSTIFLANGYIQSFMKFDDDKDQWFIENGKAATFRKDKVVITGQSGTGTILSNEEAGKMIKNLKKLLHDE